MGLVRRALLLTALCAAVLPAAAHADLIGICGDDDLCSSTDSGKTEKLTSDGASSGYSSPSASIDGARLGYLRAGEPFLGGEGGKGAESLLDTDDGRVIRLTPDGKSFVIRTFDSRVGAGGFFVESNLRVGGEIGSRLYSSSSTVYAPGFFKGDLAVTPTPESEDGGVICTVALIPSDTLPPCNQRIAVEPGRTFDDFDASPDEKLIVAQSAACDEDFNCVDVSIDLLDASTGELVRRLADGGFRPQFSPDGESVSYTAGNDTKVVPVKGGPAKTLAKDFSDAAWIESDAALGSKTLKLKGSKVALTAACKSLGGCGRDEWTLKGSGANFAIPALDGETSKSIKAKVSKGFAKRVSKAGAKGVSVKLAGVADGKPVRVAVAG